MPLRFRTINGRKNVLPGEELYSAIDHSVEVSSRGSCFWCALGKDEITEGKYKFNHSAPFTNNETVVLSSCFDCLARHYWDKFVVIPLEKIGYRLFGEELWDKIRGYDE